MSEEENVATTAVPAPEADTTPAVSSGAPAAPAQSEQESTKTAARQTMKAVIRPMVIVGAMTTLIPEPYVDWVFISWAVIVVASYDIRKPNPNGKLAGLLTALYNVMNFIACNPQVALQGLERSPLLNKAGIIHSDTDSNGEGK